MHENSRITHASTVIFLNIDVIVNIILLKGGVYKKMIFLIGSYYFEFILVLIGIKILKPTVQLKENILVCCDEELGFHVMKANSLNF
jgi:hypothetical protein